MKRACIRFHYCERENKHIFRYSVLYTTNTPEEGEGFDSDDLEECEARLKENDSAYIVDNMQCLVCDKYDARKLANKEGIVKPFYIVAYGVSRYCYSKAEGGCWDDWTDILEVRRVFTVFEALRHLRDLKEKCPQPRFNRFSAANRGEDDIYFKLCYDENDPRWPEQSTKRTTYE